MSVAELKTSDLVTALKAAAEPTRLRILLLLAGGELNVKDLTLVMGQSQPRISRHLKLLFEAGLIERFREGSWVYFHISDRQSGGRLALRLVADVDPAEPAVRLDRERADALKREREAAAQAFFEKHAADWDRIRTLHVAEREVEADENRARLRAQPVQQGLQAREGGTTRLGIFRRDGGFRFGKLDRHRGLLAFEGGGDDDEDEENREDIDERNDDHLRHASPPRVEVHDGSSTAAVPW